MVEGSFGNPAMAGTFRYEATASDNVGAVIVQAVAQLHYIPRPIVRGRLTRTNQPGERIVIAFGNGNVSITPNVCRAAVTPTNGSPTDWTWENGEEPMRVATEWKDGRLVQTFDAEDGRRLNSFSLNPDGRLLTLDVEVTSPRLRNAMRYRLVYSRAG
jgi:hypothetical protein